jgi:hypothetical protein
MNSKLPMTPANMRELGVHHLIGYCHNDACPTIRGVPFTPQGPAELKLASEREPHQQGSQ